MEFQNSQTFINLARSFAGESQAGMRYQLIAKQATAEGYAVLADNIRTIAKNETYHAKTFFNTILQNAGSIDNVDLQNAGYPFHFGTLEENLKFAAEDERAEFEEIYAAFANVAKEEGFPDVAAIYNMVVGVEKEHNIIFKYLHEAFKTNTLYKSEKPTLWICSECGYRVTSKEAWHICPLCKASQGYVEIHLPFEKNNI
ncbi:rubrerythrin family protein [Candidatus Borkfalkia ceftriaxoniphila]|jgi:rubrerythrin|uniref:Rubrerythrin family protein n=1 Tax=Candidatus Borkfalkia ceftriaxoniphila TaxID=2508949 RepID=A0A4V1QV23_9FIRM|nr:ferritin family protein [Candidatus Borkfalkia ceftriaxoniphila]RXZ61156.1 rubrerythrin family protein [Candidatus Borkfalkia ceftriaxoniphila]